MNAINKFTDWLSKAPPWVLGSGHSFCTVLTMCAHHFRCPYALCVQIYNTSVSYYTLKIMLLCGFHWHSRCSIWDFYIYFMHFQVVYREFLYPISTKCDQIQWEMVDSNINQQYSTCSCLFLHIFTSFVMCDIHHWNGFDWIRQSGYGTDVCLHYTLNDIMLQNTFFTFLLL